MTTYLLLVQYKSLLYVTQMTMKCSVKEEIANLHLLNLSEVCVFAAGKHRASFVELSFDLCALIVQH